ncbi:hypothetical protein ACET3Z_009764 [Daucus carota]
MSRMMMVLLQDVSYVIVEVVWKDGFQCRDCPTDDKERFKPSVMPSYWKSIDSLQVRNNFSHFLDMSVGYQSMLLQKKFCGQRIRSSMEHCSCSDALELMAGEK